MHRSSSRVEIFLKRWVEPAQLITFGRKALASCFTLAIGQWSKWVKWFFVSCNKLPIGCWEHWTKSDHLENKNCTCVRAEVLWPSIFYWYTVPFAVDNDSWMTRCEQPHCLYYEIFDQSERQRVHRSMNAQCPFSHVLPHACTFPRVCWPRVHVRKYVYDKVFIWHTPLSRGSVLHASGCCLDTWLCTCRCLPLVV